MEQPGGSRIQQKPPMKKKKPGRGRTMTVKVFYSLDNSRSSKSHGSNQSTSNTGANLSESNSGEIAQNYTCLARLTSPLWVELLGSPQRDDRPLVEEFGKLTLKTCLSAICISRPQLVDDPSKDYAISAVDPYESSLLPNYLQPLGAGQGLMEGKGMLSWNLAERKQGTTWVCGRVSGGGAELERKRKKQRLDVSKEGAIELIDSEEEEDFKLDTLEVFLHLVERPAFTPDQFLTSLRSFANPARAHPSSDRASSPPPRFNRGKSTLGDPVKKRPRDLPPVSNGFTLPQPIPKPSKPSTSALPSATASTSTLPDLASLQGPEMLALLSASLSKSTGPEGKPKFALDTEQSKALLPAIRSLAKFYGMEMPANVGGPAPPMNVVASVKGKERQLPNAEILIPNPFANLTTGTIPPLLATANIIERPPSVSSNKPEDINIGSIDEEALKKVKGKRRKMEVFAPILKDEGIKLDEKGVQIKASKFNPAGCVNCGRKNSSNWRGNIEGHVACNVCGIYYNKNFKHRVMPDRGTSPAPAVIPTPFASTSGRSLQPRLTATCEADLRSQQSLKKRKVRPGMIAPPSPSKHIGPYRRHSPGTDFASIFKPNGTGSRTISGGIMTSPGRSPRRASKRLNGIAATSPVRGSYRMENNYDFNAIYAAHQSPSPERNPAIPDYLLTASPGTALKRVLSDTDFGAFTGGFGLDIDHGRDVFGPTRRSDVMAGEGDASDLNYFLRSSPDEKENAPPSTLLNPSDPVTAVNPGFLVPATDFDSILSSLRNDFVARISENGVGGPSSPIPSSPCVQPRTSSATPGQKGKAPTSSGRLPPSILDSFIDGLVPAIALGRDSQGKQTWTTELESEQDRNQEFDLSQLLLPNRVLAKPFLSGSNHLLPSEGSDFDFNLDPLPPSSPPALPNALTPDFTPDFDGVTPEGDSYMMEEENYKVSETRKVSKEAVAEMIRSLGLPSIPTEAWEGLGSSIQLDSKMVTHLLELIEAKAVTTPVTPLEDPHEGNKERRQGSMYEEMFSHI